MLDLILFVHLMFFLSLLRYWHITVVVFHIMFSHYGDFMVSVHRVFVQGREKLPAHQIDGDRKQLLAEQIRQQLLAGTLSPSPSHQATPLVIPSLRLRHGKEKGDKKSAPYSQFPLLNFAHDVSVAVNSWTDLASWLGIQLSWYGIGSACC